MTAIFGLRPGFAAAWLRRPLLFAVAWLALGSAGAQTQLFPGFLKREYFSIAVPPVSGLASFTNDSSFPSLPAEIDFLKAFESTPYQTFFGPGRANYGVKLTGLLTPTNSGDYVFYLSATGQAELWVSTDATAAHLQPVALEPSGSGVRNWAGAAGRPASSNLFPGQRQPNISLPVTLVAGQAYFVQALVANGTGRGHVEVAWAPAAGPDPAAGSAPIAAEFLSVYASPTLIIDRQPEDVVAAPGTVAVFNLTAEGNPLNHTAAPGQSGANEFVQWFVNNRPSGSGSPFSYGPVSLSDDGSLVFGVVQDFAGGRVKSRVAKLSVPKPTNGPVVVAVTGGSDLSTVLIRFTDAMNPATAGNAGFYTIALPDQPTAVVTILGATVTASNVVQLTTARLLPAIAYKITFAPYRIHGASGLPLLTLSTTFFAPRYQSGIVAFERWDGFSGGVPDLITNTVLAGVPPSFKTYVGSFETRAGTNAGPFGGRLSCDFLPPVTGDYVFFVAATNQARLFLGTDEYPENDRWIAEEPSGARLRRWKSKTGRPNGENRSDLFAGTEWPTGGAITLAAGKAYHLELYFVSADGLGYAGATFKNASDKDPSDGGIATLGALVRSVVDSEIAAPVITVRPAGQHFKRGDAVTLSVTALGTPPLSYSWYQNKRLLPFATTNSFTLVNAGPEAVGDYYCVVSNRFGQAGSYPDDDARLLMSGAFVVEAEDFNFSSGRTLAGASFMPLAPGQYQGLDGVPQVDFRLMNESSTNAADGGNEYRNGWVDASGVVHDFATAPWDSLGNVDIFANDADSDRGDFAVSPNYRASSRASGEYFDYTRSFPPGRYSVIVAASKDGAAAAAFSTSLEVLYGRPKDRNGGSVTVGAVVGDGTGAYGSNDLLIYTNSAGTTSIVELGNAATVRVRNTSGGPASTPQIDFDYLLFYLEGASTPQPTVTLGYDVNGVLTLYFTGSLQSAPQPDGPWNTVSGASSPYPVPPGDGTPQYFRSMQ